MNGTRPLARGVLVLAMLAGTAGTAAAQHTLKVTVPVGVSFNVLDVSATTAGTPVTQVTWSNPSGFSNAEVLRILVQPVTVNFAGPGTTRIPASNVSWTAAASNGTPSNGSLNSASYTLMFVSASKLKNPDSGTVTQTWSLAPVAAVGLRSGTHTLTMRWRFEFF
jgi:hypothetical protein